MAAARALDGNDLANNTHHWYVTKEKTNNSQSCLNCHHEHQGAEKEQTAIEDSKCLDCHSNLENVMTSLSTEDNELTTGSGQYFKDEGITNFTSFSEHPPFRNMSPTSDEPDPGKIKF